MIGTSTFVSASENVEFIEQRREKIQDIFISTVKNIKKQQFL